MRRAPLPLGALVLLAAPAAAPADTGGTTVPPPARPTAREFAIVPAAPTVGQPAQVAFRVDGPMRRVRVTVALTPTDPAAAQPVLVRMGWKSTGRRYVQRWTPATAGEYTAALRATDAAGHGLRRTARASGRSVIAVKPPPPPSAVGIFPVQGDYSFGGPEAGFGAVRTGHTHLGQDIPAPSGTPVVTPVAGTVHWVAYQAAGAGHYVVVDGADGRAYVFMHLLAGSVTAVKGQSLTAGQQIAAVGSTGESTGPHLHFEIWVGGWYASAASHAIDPLPGLQAWAGAR
jgi:murein DD-endopeptidase MepM/ murein hydrolase activator NlpD